MIERFIPTRTHGIVDYVTGATLAAVPWLFHFDDEDAATNIMVTLGAGALAYSLLTDYELGAKKVIPMDTHLKLDAASGVLLAASPWLFGFARRVWVPHVIFGVFEVIASLSTRRSPERDSAL
jgi:hypothetical protein